MNHNVKIPFYKIILVRHNEFEQFTLSEKLCWVQFAQSELLDTCHAATIPLGGRGDEGRGDGGWGDKWEGKYSLVLECYVQFGNYAFLVVGGLEMSHVYIRFYRKLQA